MFCRKHRFAELWTIRSGVCKSSTAPSRWTDNLHQLSNDTENNKDYLTPNYIRKLYNIVRRYIVAATEGTSRQRIKMAHSLLESHHMQILCYLHCAPVSLQQSHGYKPNSVNPRWLYGRRPNGHRYLRSSSLIGKSLMEAYRLTIRPRRSNSQFSLPYERNQLPDSSHHSYANRTAIRLSSWANNSLIKRYSRSLYHFLVKKAIISSRPFMNSDRLRHLLSEV